MPDRTATCITFAADYPKGHLIALHDHAQAQVIFAKRGLMRVMSGDGVWVVPPERAIWMPAGVRHEIHCSTPLAMRTVYLEGFVGLGGRCAVVAVSPLLREVLIRLCEADGGPARDALLAVLAGELRILDIMPLHLPEPTDRRLVPIARALMADPGDNRPLCFWAHAVGASTRTLIRLFQAETGMTFRAWQRQLRLLAALERLGQGQPVTTVAFDLGYESGSAFTAAFRRALGVPPSRWLDRAGTTRALSQGEAGPG